MCEIDGWLPGDVQIGVLARCCLGVLFRAMFGVLFEVLVTVRERVCEIDGRGSGGHAVWGGFGGAW